MALTACGCGELGLHDTALADARVFDATPDARPPSCPAFATPLDPPMYRPDSHQVSTISCASYVPSPSVGMAAALCDFGTGVPVPAYGAIDADLTMLTFSPHQPGAEYAQAVLLPENNEIWLHAMPATTLTALEEIEVYRLTVGIATYSRTISFPTFPVGSFTIGAPATGRRFVYTDQTSNPVPHELIEDGAGNVTEVTGAFQNFSGWFVDGSVNMSNDGLRVVLLAIPIGGSKQLIYSARVATGDAFAAPVPLAGVPGTSDAPYLREDCGRIYFDVARFIYYINEAT